MQRFAAVQQVAQNDPPVTCRCRDAHHAEDPAQEGGHRAGLCSVSPLLVMTGKVEHSPRLCDGFANTTGLPLACDLTSNGEAR